MKHYMMILALLCLGLQTSGIAAQDYVRDNYCMQTEQMELKYSNLDENHKIVGYFTHKMTLCNGTPASGNFAYDLSAFKADGSPLIKDQPIRMEATITGEGPTESTLKGMGKVMKIQGLMTKGDVSTIPPVLKAGMTIPDSEVKLHIDSFNCSLYTSERNVQEEVSLTTPAGTFDCFLITETQKMKTVGTQTEKLKTWYAKGIGVVKQEFYNKKNELIRSMELISLSVK